MRSHKKNLKNHNQKFDGGNLLTRGQTVKMFPNEETKPVVLLQEKCHCIIQNCKWS